MVGVLDVGSNSVRLLIRDNGATLYKNNIITQLAKDFDGKLLSIYSINRTVEALVYFINLAKERKCEKVFAFGTEALRKADNSGILLSKVKEQTGVEIKIISGEEEAELGLLGVLMGNDGGIIDIGGASTEITISKDKKTIYSHSLDVGVVRLFDICGDSESKLEEYTKNKIKEYKKVPLATMYGIGGTITSVASMLQELLEYDANKINGYVITKGNLLKLKEKIFSLKLEERKNIIGIQEKRAKVIAGGVVLLLNIMDYLNIDNLIASDNDNLEGFLIKEKLYD
ncbi:MAG: hypothetical protein KBS91_04800 [Firmicutes bacterium]|nr:hypothetical protein [Candidatus Caballimonas caccae]